MMVAIDDDDGAVRVMRGGMMIYGRGGRRCDGARVRCDDDQRCVECDGGGGSEVEDDDDGEGIGDDGRMMVKR